jgi:hypothetical protein
VNWLNRCNSAGDSGGSASVFAASGWGVGSGTGAPNSGTVKVPGLALSGAGVGAGAGTCAIVTPIGTPTSSNPKPNGSTRVINCRMSRINCRFMDFHQGDYRSWVWVLLGYTLFHPTDFTRAIVSSGLHSYLVERHCPLAGFDRGRNPGKVGRSNSRRKREKIR